MKKSRFSGQDQGVGAFVVLEVIVNAFLLEQAREEGEIRLVVLDAVTDFLVAVEEFFLDREGVVGEDLVGDVDHGLVLEDLAVGGAAS